MTIDTKRLATDAAYWDECGAPEDATHYCAAKKEWINGHCHSIDVCCIPRPTKDTVSVEWEDGIPKIGWHGECTWGTKVDWCECVILPRKRAAIDMSQRGQGWEIESLDDHEFRELRTKEQRLKDELVGLILAERESVFPHQLMPKNLADAVIEFFERRYNLEPKL